MSQPNLPHLTASWIWRPQDRFDLYHQVISARRSFDFQHPGSAVLRIAIDGGYRLLINGQWAGDGPARSWPNHFQYDVHNISAHLVSGPNQVEIIARHWQVGDFHSQPLQAGLLAQIDLFQPDGSVRSILSDSSWQIAELPAWASHTPKVSIQMEPQEVYDARRENESLIFWPAQVLFGAEEGPWKGLHPRDVALLDRRPLSPALVKETNLVKPKTDPHFCFPAVRLAHPGVVEANHSAAAAGGIATLLTLDQPATIQLWPGEMVAAIDGVTNPDYSYDLSAGEHTLCAFAWPLFNHHKERTIQIANPPGDLRLVNPLAPDDPNPWVYLPMPEFTLREDDLTFIWFNGPEKRRDAASAGYQERIHELLAELRRPSDILAFSGAQRMPAAEMFALDTHWAFVQREVTGSAAGLVEDPGAMLHDNASLTTVHPSAQGDVELALDLGVESVGYWQFELLAEAGVEVDLYAVEYMHPDLGVQHTGDNRNGLRYITRAGLNRFTSLKRRAGRYLFVTLRSQHDPVRIRLLRVIESTYPVEQLGGFDCSDAGLRRIWEIAARTLTLCMEDTFTDCPLYEQTLWVGDAHNESIYALDLFGAEDIVRRYLRLTAQSLEHLPLAGCQVPSGWDCLIPSFSFLWGMAVWNLYQYNGDQSVIAEFWPAVIQNIEGAQARIGAHGLFGGPYWNMLDWTDIDDHHEVVLHNNLMLVGAIQAAEKMAGLLGDSARMAWLAGLRAGLVSAINRCWDPARQAYPDSLLEDGSFSPSICQHTHLLALLYDIVEPANQAAALRNVIEPGENVVRIGSPFVFQFLYEMLDQNGMQSEILRSIRANFLPMLAAGASTVWESFPSGSIQIGGFPTRSHCHAWSSSPVSFLPRVVLGIRQAGCGGEAYIISPWVEGLVWANGSICTTRGRLEVEWRKLGSRLEITTRAPLGVSVTVTRNPSMQGLDVEVI